LETQCASQRGNTATQTALFQQRRPEIQEKTGVGEAVAKKIRKEGEYYLWNFQEIAREQRAREPEKRPPKKT
jgi:hypothetical protein